MIIKNLKNNIISKMFFKPLYRFCFFTKQQQIYAKWRDDNGDTKLRFNYNLKNSSVVFDVGGYTGQWAIEIFNKYDCNIFIFEPIKEFGEIITKKFAQNNKVKIFQSGLGGKTRKAKINKSGTASSIFGESDNNETINIVDVVEFFSENNISSVQLMKINIEGGEYELLNRLIESGIIGIIENIQVQFHDITKDSVILMESIQKQLTHTHIPTYQYKFVWENWKLKMHRDKMKNRLRAIIEMLPKFMQDIMVSSWHELKILKWKVDGSPVPPPKVIKRKVLKKLANRYKLKIFLETGTSHGDMLDAMKNHFTTLYSIELSKVLWNKAKERFKNNTNINLIYGDSGKEIKNVIKIINLPTLFWLDAHYSGVTTARGEIDTPIFEELNHILNTSNFQYIIAIDDARLFGTDPAYPTVDALKQFVHLKNPELKIQIKNDIIKIYPK